MGIDINDIGCLLGVMVVETRDKSIIDICKVLSKEKADISREYLALLMWIAHWRVSQTFGQYANQTLIAMHTALNDIEGESYNAEVECFLQNRYSGYYTAISEGSKASDKGKVLQDVANYFMACCCYHGRSIKYEELIPDLEVLKLLHDAGDLQPKVYPAMVQWIEDRTDMFVDGLKRVLSRAGDNNEKFIDEMHTMLLGIPWESMRLISQRDENQALSQISIRLLEAKDKGDYIFGRELIEVAKEFTIPPSYPMDPLKSMPIIDQFTEFASVVESFIHDFVREL